MLSSPRLRRIVLSILPSCRESIDAAPRMQAISRTCSFAHLDATRLDADTSNTQLNHLQRRRALPGMFAWLWCGMLLYLRRIAAELFSASSDLHGDLRSLQSALQKTRLQCRLIVGICVRGRVERGAFLRGI